MNPLPEPSGELKPSETSAPSAPSGSSVPGPDSVPVVSELMLLPDGRILAHHLTPELASFLRTVLDPEASTPDPESTTP
jgi:hypothetical protein